MAKILLVDDQPDIRFVMGEFLESQAKHLFLFAMHQFAESPIDRQEPPARRHQADSHRRLLEYGPKPRLRLAQCLFRPLAIGDIMNSTHQKNRFPCFVNNRFTYCMDGFFSAIPTD